MLYDKDLPLAFQLLGYYPLQWSGNEKNVLGGGGGAPGAMACLSAKLLTPELLPIMI
jgi:hypothetical protein